MLDSTLPNSMFSGKDDLYSLLRETRAYTNYLEQRINILENKDKVAAQILTGEDAMANTSSIPALRVAKMKAKKRK